MGIAIQSSELADYFFDLLTNDKELLRKTGDSAGRESSEPPDPRYEPFDPPRHFKALQIGGPPEQGERPPAAESARPTRVLPILTPDNYVDNVMRILASARESIDVVVPYISSVGEEKAPNLQKVLNALHDAQARNPKLKVRILLRAFDKRSIQALQQHCDWLIPKVGFLGKRSGLNLSSKLVIVDRRVALVSSANWSEAGVSKNRDVGLMIDSPLIAGLFGEIVDEDWKHSDNIDKALKLEEK